jgi:hypothetical protein
MRIGEANNLRIRDVIPFRDSKGRSNYRFIVRGKTGERDVILRTAVARRVDKLLTKRAGEDANNFLFAMPDGSRIITLIDQLNESASVLICKLIRFEDWLIQWEACHESNFFNCTDCNVFGVRF